MQTHRTRRVADLISREIASIIQRSIKDPRVSLVTVTGAEVSPDLRSAKVFYSVLGDEEKRAETADALERAKGFMRRELGSRLELKATPELRFVYDDTLDRGMRIENLLSGNPDGQAGKG
jgi:ribosome-binding factor A